LFVFLGNNMYIFSSAMQIVKATIISSFSYTVAQKYRTLDFSGKTSSICALFAQKFRVKNMR